ncbi:iron-sulfur cluster carrier protein ApbC [Aureimonas fodinaquatilis]|uniref:Iron-sulfur cluster carrier protein n=1 Tax=Aureimonas fodinaquatilis TaxID=2565783 RepID=A0A5B0E2Z3_9HYPH|nr:iron-sulfur cluster carrier protein ApbC [Aureimonas fodinaquatilis]KAA0972331.1 iron-sulfur cluster carrier protein ApbC [Aureimonas fodinaquatilis]
MNAALKDSILTILRRLPTPDGGADIVSRGMVSEVFLADGKAFFSLTVPAADAQAFEPLRLQAEKEIARLDGIESAMIALTAERSGAANRSTPPARPAAAPPARSSGKPGVPGIARIIAVASGKGGVGKSTTAVNLALGLAATGLRVGLLDADIYGPSIPRLLGLKGKPQTVGGRTLLPMTAYGLKTMSMGFLVEEDTPMIWRGPMVISALTQMLREVEWGELDVLVVDMPPGTGDAQLTMAQQVPLAGAVVVSTPQDLALIDARKGLAMFRKVEVPVLGIVENMSYFIAPDTGRRYDIFGHGGARAEAERLGVPFLGEVPLEMEIRETSDAGKPLVATQPDGPTARVYLDIAAQVMSQLEGRGVIPAPRIVFE